MRWVKPHIFTMIFRGIGFALFSQTGHGSPTSSTRWVESLYSVSDSAGTRTTNWFNNQGLLIGQTNQIGCVNALAYDIEDRGTNSTNADGIRIGTHYDVLGRMDRRYSGGG